MGSGNLGTVNRRGSSILFFKILNWIRLYILLVLISENTQIYLHFTQFGEA